MVRLEVTVSDWFYNALLGKEVLTINRNYFRLRKPLERRLYELARKHCGRQAQWSIGLANLKDNCGSLSPLKYFRYQIRAIIKADHLPDYQIALNDKDMVTFTNRYHTVKNLLSAAGGMPSLDDLPRITPATLRRAEKITWKRCQPEGDGKKRNGQMENIQWQTQWQTRRGINIAC